MVASKTLTLGVKVQILSGHQNGVSSLSGKASHCEWEEQGSSPGVHPNWNSSKVGQPAYLQYGRQVCRIEDPKI